MVLYLIFWAWHSPWAGKLTKAEIDAGQAFAVASNFAH
jgi:hypothetical protein